MLPTSELKTYRLKEKVQETVLYANGNHKKAEVVILISGKTDLKTKTLCNKRQKRTYIMIRGSIKEEDNNCKYIIHNIGAPKHIKQILTDIKWETDLVDLNTHLHQGRDVRSR